jgi:hypothetical protein
MMNRNHRRVLGDDMRTISGALGRFPTPVFAFASCLLMAGGASAQTITVFDPPGSINTAATGVNDKGVVAGKFLDSGLHWHGFLRSPDGTITSFDAPGGVSTEPQQINHSASVVGVYYDADNVAHGFLLSPSGNFVTLDYPGANFTAALNISDQGTIVGTYSAGAGQVGYVLYPYGGFQSVDPNNGSSAQPDGVNASGTVSGYFYDQTFHGFVETSNGAITTFDAPGATSTFARTINNRGTVVGEYTDANNIYHGFLRRASGAMVSFDPPRSVFTEAVAINNEGATAGVFIDKHGRSVGFMRLAHNRFTTFACPNSPNTQPNAINGHQEIVGTCADKHGATHGFIFTP